MDRFSGKYLRRWMRALDLSYEEVAANLHVHPITVRNWEKDGVPFIAKLAFDRVYRPYFRPDWRVKPRKTRGILGP
jgi:hypothetical protein